MRPPLLATVLVAALTSPLGTQPPTDSLRADSVRADSTRADSARPLRPNPRLRPRPAAPVPRRPGANAGERLAPPGSTPAATPPLDTTPSPRRPIGSGVKVRKEPAAPR